MLHQCVMLALVATSALAKPSSPQKQVMTSISSQDSFSLATSLGHLFKVYSECAANDISICLKLKLVAAMERADRSLKELHLINGVDLVKTTNSTSMAVPKSESEIEAALPRSLQDKNLVLNSLITNKISDILNSHVLQVKLPNATEMQRSLVEEGRKRKEDKEPNNMSMIYTILLSVMLPLAIKGLAIFAGNALLVSVIAVVLSTIVGIGNFIPKQVPPPPPHHYNPNYYNPRNGYIQEDNLPYPPAPAGNYNARNYMGRDEDPNNPQDLVYNAYQKSR